MKQYDVLIVGGGAAGFFTAINIKEKNPQLKVCILEKGNDFLQKVKISGGGRCNVTHACFAPRELTQFYPRGDKELLGPFHQFMTGDTMGWFEERGVPLKIEADNRIFPESNSSQSIIDCFMSLVKSLDIQIFTNQGVKQINKEGNTWRIITSSDEFIVEKLVITSGSSKQMWKLLSSLGHKVIQPVPSLFTFNIKDSFIDELQGVCVQDAEVSLKDTKLSSTGSLLITHWGISGPAVLKLSAFGAIHLAEKNYQYQVKVNWLSKSKQQVQEELFQCKKENVKKQLLVFSPFETISKRLWNRFLEVCQINSSIKWADITHKQIDLLSEKLTDTVFHAQGKSTFKEEFVTAGGIDLKEINFKRFESKLHPNLFLAGEVLNIDAVTGGFNFQNAWTGGWVVSESITG